MKKMLLCLLSMPLISSAGSLDPSSGPAPTMVTLQEMYDKLVAIPSAVTNEAGASSADVLAGKEFWGLTTAEWGPRTGTIPDQGAGPSITPTSVVQTLSAGYYSSDISVDGDADLIADNIAQGVEIFGITGELSGGGGGAVWKTGQTVSYNASGTVDPATRDDGFYQKGIPDGQDRFTDNGDNTITDNLTGLMWHKNWNIWTWGYAWNDMMNWIENGLDSNNTPGTWPGAYTDWRMPNLNEMRSVIPMPYGYFVNQHWSGGDYWTSTADPAGPSEAYLISARFGTISTAGKGSGRWAVPVRDAN